MQVVVNVPDEDVLGFSSRSVIVKSESMLSEAEQEHSIIRPTYTEEGEQLMLTVGAVVSTIYL